MFVVDDAAIAAAIAAAEAEAAAAAAGATAAEAAAAGTAAAETTAATTAASTAATGAETGAATTAADSAIVGGADSAAGATGTQGGIADALGSEATAAQGEMGPGWEQAVNEVANQPAQQSAYATNFAPQATESAVQPAATAPVEGAAQPAPIDMAAPQDVGANAPTDIAQDGTVNVQAGMDAAAAPGGGGSPSITDQLADYGKSVVKEMMTPKSMLPAAASAGSAAWQQSNIDAEQERQNAANTEAMNRVRASGDKINASVNKWASENLNPTAMQANTDQAYNDLTSSYDQFLAGANRNSGAPAGSLSTDYTKAISDGMTGASQKAADYARKLAKTQAPAFANLKSNLGELILQRDAGSALSDANSAAAIGRATAQTQNGGAGMLGAAALRGLGQGLGSKL